jgi:hypothetical protein
VSALVGAYNPCLSCSTHALGMVPVKLSLVGPDGEVLGEKPTDYRREGSPPIRASGGDYSQRSACWGWMRVIRRAGTQAAPSATAAIATAIPPKTSGSAPDMRKKRAFRARLSP